ncbi:hypothetical protein [Vibrio chaetopteri]|uniref:Lipoprotein n=1 Tax=Vibrio chaetopteri TaxID=3016528 RepID=A0AAU8BRK5_9VIBR
MTGISLGKVAVFIACYFCSNVASANEVMEQALANSVRQAPLTAVVSRVSVVRVDSGESGWDEYEYNAEVLELINGESPKDIRYSVYVEAGDDVTLDKAPILLSLCSDGETFYSPGVGTIFPASQSLINLARIYALDNTNLSEVTFDICK